MQALLLDLLARKTFQMPVSTKKRLAWLLSGLTWNLLKLRRNYVTDTLIKQLSLSRDEAEKLGRKTYYSFLLNAFEMAGLKLFSPQQLIDRVECEGLEHLKTALSHKKGAIIISGHFGLWELVPSWLALNGFDVSIVVRRQNNPEADRWMEEMRQKHGPKTTDSGYSIREILKSLRKGHILALMVDQDNGKQGIFVKFFNAWASAPTGPALISLKTGAPIVPLAMFPDYNHKHQLKIFHPIMPEQFTNDTAGQQKLTAEYTKILENLIRKQPEQWFWLHRRWKTQPADAPDNQWVKIIKSSLTSDTQAS
jgi:KDO2-lipid IV(A) lauroyltransferase